MPNILVMGVSGSGKSSVGRPLAERLKLPFIEGDNYHTEHNKAKMEALIPLDDQDRAPWLAALAREIAALERGGGCVLACSALKEKYRERLRSSLDEPLRIIYLEGARETLTKRLEGRDDHFFPPHLLDSQLDTLEHPHQALVLDIRRPIKELVEEAADWVESLPEYT